MKSKRKSISNLSRDKIVTEAIAIADRDGIPGLTMRKLAEALGVEAMSLYHHIKNKKELITEMVDAVVPMIPRLESCVDWKDALRKRAGLMREALIRHPWAAHEFVTGINVGPNMLRYVDTTTGYFLTAGFSYKLTDYAWNVIDSYMYGFNLQSQNFPLQPSEYKEAAKQFLPMIPKDTYPHMHTMAQVIIGGEYDGIQDFNFGIEIILESLERLLHGIQGETE
ncbi:MAG TPA: TetR/AcrR family transcriptional regulator C-terminal domain-containing protein [Candidatus Saccharimonadaceae bacterium]|nr:TetR/AcrR family transcriptional regulator C-terminal domain-containing protein [Candidatus Saccharimonadaceae bacterium]